MKKIGLIGHGDIGLSLAMALMMKKSKTVMCTTIPPVKSEPCREPFSEPILKKEVIPFNLTERDSDFRKRLFNNKNRYSKAKPNKRK